MISFRRLLHVSRLSCGIHKHYIERTRFSADKVADSVNNCSQTAIDEFHLGGQPATDELAVHLHIHSGHLVLDLGSGLGGPARRIAARYNCNVLGVDYLEEFVQTARSITQNSSASAINNDYQVPRLNNQPFYTGFNGSASHYPSVWFQQGDLTLNDWLLGLKAGQFSAAYMQHVAMHFNRQQQRSLWRTINNSVLRAGGRFAIYDVFAGDAWQTNPLHPSDDFPLPFASQLGECHLYAGKQVLTDIASSGLTKVYCADQTAKCIDWLEQGRRLSASQPGKPNMKLIMGRDLAAVKSANMLRLLRENRLQVLLAVFQN